MSNPRFENLTFLEERPMSCRFYNEVNHILLDLPEYLYHLLVLHDYYVVLPRQFTDYYRYLKGVKPRADKGWDPQKTGNTTYDHVGGLHDSNIRTITYPEYWMKPFSEDRLRKNNTTPSWHVLYHEIGHAMDCIPYYQGYCLWSTTKIFKVAYYKDVSHLRQAAKAKLKFNLDNYDSVCLEIFAEAFCALIHSRKYKGRTASGFMAAEFPRVVGVVSEVLDMYQTHYQDEALLKRGIENLMGQMDPSRVAVG